jgi:hypothetical protein
MAVSPALTEFLQENLNKVTAPSSYDSLRQKLMESKPTHKASAIEQSPENSLKIDGGKIE